ncbi:MAG TPA: sigma-70 family RNA polymerase sigma factor [Myxococcota bacterium]|nr:sigma-70 family RNA polymerase sigma factor [Myxococcota bacterium]
MAEDADPPVPAPGGVAPGQDPDVQLMLAFRSGDRTAFDQLFRRWAGPMLRYLERMVRDAGSAEDLLQETFLRVFRAKERYQPEARFSTWVYTIATNLALNELRRPRRRAPHRSADEGESDEVPLVLEGHEPRADDVIHARRASAELERELAALPERQRAALLLSAVEGLSYAEVAVSLETTEKSVKALVHRARATLAAKFKGRE